MAHDLLDAPSLYDTDVLAWSEQQAALIRARRFSDNALDWDNIAEEIEDVGKNVYRGCRSQLRNILAHLLKIEFIGPADVVPHWRGEIVGFRKELADELTPTIRHQLLEEVDGQFATALKALVTKGKVVDPKRIRAARPGYTWDQIIDEDWYPEPRYGGASPP